MATTLDFREINPVSSSVSLPDSGVLLSIFIICHYLCRQRFKPCKCCTLRWRNIGGFQTPLHYSWALFDWCPQQVTREKGMQSLRSAALQWSHQGECTTRQNHLLESCPRFLPVNFYKIVSTRLLLNNVQQQMRTVIAKGAAANGSSVSPLLCPSFHKHSEGIRTHTQSRKIQTV